MIFTVYTDIRVINLYLNKIVENIVFRAFPFGLPRSTLRPMPGRPVRVVVLEDGRLLLNDGRFGARTRHCGTQENVDDHHDNEEHGERYRQNPQPWWVPTAFPKSCQNNTFVRPRTNNLQF